MLPFQKSSPLTILPMYLLGQEGVSDTVFLCSSESCLPSKSVTSQQKHPVDCSLRFLILSNILKFFDFQQNFHKCKSFHFYKSRRRLWIGKILQSRTYQLYNCMFQKFCHMWLHSCSCMSCCNSNPTYLLHTAYRIQKNV